MSKLILLFALAAAIAIFPALTNAADRISGSLVIVGGALADDNESIYRAFIERAGPDHQFAVIAAASAAPAESADRFRQTLIRYGVTGDNVATIKLALNDDPSTADIDESEWAANAANPDEIAKVEHASAIWFAGGDQSRLTKLLLRDDGADTPMLAAIRQRLTDGAVIGGTSAGAAIMSRLMIAGGDSLGAMFAAPAMLPIGESAPETGDGLFLSQGLGFFTPGVVDQHFDQRGRLGRLAVATLQSPAKIGFGVDENTAFIIDLETDEATVRGAGAVTLLEGSAAALTAQAPFAADGFSVSVMSAGDAINLQSLTITPAPFKKPTVGAEYVAAPLPSGAGVAVPYPGIGDFLGEGLVDNSAAMTLEAISFTTDGRGVRFTFQQVDDSAGFWGRDQSGRAGYTIKNIRYSIAPVDVRIESTERR